MFKYTLKGIVANGDGLSLALYYSDQNLDDRTIVKIQNGGFTFHGSCDYMKELYIRFEKNIDNLSGYSRKLVHTEPGVITIRFDVAGDPSYYRFSNFEVLTGPDNIFRRQFFTEYKKALGERPLWIFPESSQMDYMRKYVYPGPRSRVLKLYEKYFAEETSAIHLYLLKSITDQTQGPGEFNGEYLKGEEIELIRNLFSKLDPNLAPGLDYKRVKAAVEELGKVSQVINFIDYTLPSIDGKEIQLSKVVQVNKLTLLTFWHTACGPCRAFHKEVSAQYSELKKRGFEVISLNVDDSKSLWKKSSTEDAIAWPNLYIGGGSELLARYHIKRFPSKRLYDNTLSFVGIEAKNSIGWWNAVSKKCSSLGVDKT
ncbi:MAG: AhpC/TSA family protein [Saprospiraceae bacterium]|nr:AhpC/TSA family protein [Saprospiraceae bacterium]